MDAPKDRALTSNKEVAKKALAAQVMAAAGPMAGVSKSRKRWALAVAAVVDAMQMGLFPAFIGGAVEPPELIADSVTAAVLLLILGFRWRLVMGFVAELVPGLDLFPTWTALVLSLPVAAEVDAKVTIDTVGETIDQTRGDASETPKELPEKAG